MTNPALISRRSREYSWIGSGSRGERGFEIWSGRLLAVFVVDMGSRAILNNRPEKKAYHDKKDPPLRVPARLTNQPVGGDRQCSRIACPCGKQRPCFGFCFTPFRHGGNWQGNSLCRAGCHSRCLRVPESAHPGRWNGVHAPVPRNYLPLCNHDRISVWYGRRAAGTLSNYRERNGTAPSALYKPLQCKERARG
jgi:hypothetical protein